MADVKLLKYDGSEQQYLGVERVQLAKLDGSTVIFSEGEAVEGVEISPDFSSGDMPVLAPAGTLVKSAVIVKPEELIPGNIRRGVTVAGIQGDLGGDTEERTVALSMSDGDQIILPTQDGKAISKVTVVKPETLVPENILAGVEIGGVTGTLDPPDPVETEVTLDFSEGDMEVVPDAGKLFSKVSIPVPENLIPENIAKDVIVAGITGTHEGGGEAIPPVIQALEITENGTYTAPEGVDGYSPVTVSIKTGVDTEDIDLYLDQINGEIIGERVFVVTFVYNGTTYQEEVFEGRDCPDPVSAGKIETPTKESTKYATYPFNGWSFTNGGAADSDALSKIESDRTVYAAFREELIYIATGSCGPTTSWKLNPDYVMTIDGTGAMNDGKTYDIIISGGVVTTDNRPWSAFVKRITEVIIMPGVTKICGRAFCSCSELTSISLAEGITEIQMDAFQFCTGLQSVTMPSTMQYIYGGAFSGTGIRSITLPYGMRWFRITAFSLANLDSFILSRTDGWRYGAQSYSETNYTELTPEEAADSATVLERMRGGNAQYWWNLKWMEETA